MGVVSDDVITRVLLGHMNEIKGTFFVVIYRHYCVFDLSVTQWLFGQYGAFAFQQGGLDNTPGWLVRVGLSEIMNDPNPAPSQQYIPGPNPTLCHDSCSFLTNRPIHCFLGFLVSLSV